MFSPPNVRDGRVMKMGQRYIPTSNVYITKRIGNVSPLGSQGYKPNYNPNGNNYNRITQNVAPSEVSETDLYLLGAIEKLVYRVDYMEKRLRKTEQLVYYLMAGNNQNKKEIIGNYLNNNYKSFFLLLLQFNCIQFETFFQLINLVR